MPTYQVILWQDGGCDYTIECGTRVETLGVYENIDAAVSALSRSFTDEFGEDEDDPLDGRGRYFLDGIDSAVVQEVGPSRAVKLKPLRDAVKRREAEARRLSEIHNLERKLAALKGRTKPSERSEEPEDNKDVHTEHCCEEHGCKYGDPDCPVETGRKKASFPCESCSDD